MTILGEADFKNYVSRYTDVQVYVAMMDETVSWQGTLYFLEHGDALILGDTGAYIIKSWQLLRDYIPGPKADLAPKIKDAIDKINYILIRLQAAEDKIAQLQARIP